MSVTKSSIENLTQQELFQKINDICYTVNSVTDNKELLEISLRKIMELFDAERGSVFRLKEDAQELALETACGMAVKEERAMVKRMGKGIVGRVAESKEPIIVDDIAHDNRFLNFKRRGSYKTASFICAPLMIKDQLIGVINIADKVSGSRFQHSELQLLDFLAAQIALNFRRIELNEKFRMIVQESQSLKDELGKSSQETRHLKKKVIVQERLASIGKLAGGIAHEFNNPLDGVMRYTNLCLEQTHEDDVLREYLLEIKHGLNRMAGIVRNLLACSRNPMPSQQSIDLSQALNQSLQFVGESLLRKDIRIEKDYAPEPIQLTDLGVERIFSNIIQNAIDAIEQTGTIRITSRLEDDMARVDIEDNGCGIPEDQLVEIFEPFYTTKNIEKGCGLGLTIVDEIVKSYEGRIDVARRPEGGTHFSIFIPIK